jgi:hypothetical protein
MPKHENKTPRQGHRTLKRIEGLGQERKKKGAKIFADEVPLEVEGVTLSLYSYEDKGKPKNGNKKSAYFWDEIKQENITIASGSTLETAIQAALESTFQEMAKRSCVFTVAACFKKPEEKTADSKTVNENNSAVTLMTANMGGTCSALLYSPPKKSPNGDASNDNSSPLLNLSSGGGKLFVIDSREIPNTNLSKTSLLLTNMSAEQYSKLADKEKADISSCSLSSSSLAKLFGKIKNNNNDAPHNLTRFARINTLQNLTAGKLVFLITASSLLSEDEVIQATTDFKTTFKKELEKKANKDNFQKVLNQPLEESGKKAVEPQNPEAKEAGSNEGNKHQTAERVGAITPPSVQIPISAPTLNSPKSSEQSQLSSNENVAPVKPESKKENVVSATTVGTPVEAITLPSVPTSIAAPDLPKSGEQPQIVIESREEKKPEQPPIKETEVVTEPKKAGQSNSPKPSGQPVIESEEKQAKRPNTIVSFRKSLIDCINAAFDDYKTKNNLEEKNCSEMFYFFKKHSYTAGNDRKETLIGKIKFCENASEGYNAIKDFFAHEGGNWNKGSFKTLLQGHLFDWVAKEKKLLQKPKDQIKEHSNHGEYSAMLDFIFNYKFSDSEATPTPPPSPK